MSTKLSKYKELSQRSTELLWKDSEHWQSFLETSARLYKYGFKDQVMIHAQRPDAVACAEYDTWGRLEITNRFVNRGSKGIALIDDSKDKSKIRYVFDFADTGARDERSKEPFFWKINEENESLVVSAMKDQYGCKSDNADIALLETTQEIVKQQGKDYLHDLISAKNGTFLEELDDFNVGVYFEKLLENSVAYSLLSRCGFDACDYFSAEDFSELHNFNSIDAITVLGTAVSDLSEQALRTIERTIKDFERSKNHERTEITTDNHGERDRISPGRGNTDLSSEPDLGGERTIGQIRQNEKEISQGEPQPIVSGNASERDTGRTSGGNRQDSEQQAGFNSSENDCRGRSDRGTESTRPDEVGRTHEQSEAVSGGDNSERADFQLNTDEAVSNGDVTDDTAFLLSDIDFVDIEPADEEMGFPNGYGQLSLFGDTDNIIDTPIKAKSQLFIGNVNVESAIHDELMRGSGFVDGKFRIVQFYQENSPSTQDFAKMLKNEYGIGGHSGQGDVGFCDYNGTGISIRIRTDSGEQPVNFTWNDVAKRIAELIDSKEYITPDDINDRILHAKYVLSYANPENEIDRYKIKAAEKILMEYGLNDKNAELSEEMYDTDNAYVLKVGNKGHIAEIEVSSTLELYERFALKGLVLNENSEDKIILDTNGKEWNKFVIPDKWGNKTNSIEAADILTPDEFKTMLEVTAKVIPTEQKVIEEPAFDDDSYFLDDEQEYKLKVGDKIELDDGIFEITKISDTDIELQDLSSIIPVFRSISEDDLYENGFALVEDNAEKTTSHEINGSDIRLGDKFNYKDREYTVVSMKGIYPDDVGIAYDEELSAGIKYQVTQNVDRYKLAHEGIYLGNFSIENDKPHEVKTPEKSGEAHNFRITDTDLGTGGAKTKFHNNIEAIKLLNELELENRNATPDEQEILSRYVGWGGLAQAFDEKNSAWSQEFTELYSLLSPDEYESVRASTLNAHYTSPTVIKAIYDGLDNLGFKSGNILEPSMGIGNFFGMLPENMSNSKLYGVELDSITGRIAKQLYPKADITVSGFESKPFPDNFFDVAVGNVPFGAYKLPDKRYDKLNLNIHDYFFAKSLDKVRAGGVVAFVTSKGTLDKANPSFRKYLAQRAELIGAIRLPNDAFKANAGTEVTSDIIFLQKRDKILDIEPEWVNLGQTADGVTVNKYFEENPQMILGKMVSGMSMYGNSEETACEPIDGAILSELLKEAVSNIQGNIPEIELDKIADGKAVESIPAAPNVRNYSFAVVDDKVYFRENSRMNRMDLPKATEDRIKAMAELRDCVRTLIDYQLNEYSDYDIQKQHIKLNRLYDDFSKKHGLINSSANAKAFSEDSSYYLLCSLEILNEQGELDRKADMFTKRTIKQHSQVTAVDTASEALAVSISEKAKVDMEFMSELTGKTEQQLFEDLQGVVFLNPMHGFSNGKEDKYVTADEYLSGNIREKLDWAKRSAEIYPDDYSLNVKALEQAMPKPLEASEIDVRLGATWIDTDIIKQFMCETLQIPRFMQRMVDVNFAKYTSEWNIDGKNVDRNNVMANMTFGTPRKNAYSILEDTLNLRDARVYDRVEQPDGKVTSVLNKKETMLAQEKQEALKNAFKDWIFKDPDRRQQLVEKYNVLFNSTRPREYDGSHINFVGMNPEIKLRPHQLNAIAHTLYGGNTLLAHQVGAGKTYEMVASAMESKRLGLCNKSLFVVPNHLTEQMGAEFLRLYPSANILVATKKDFEAKNRRRLCAKIATGDYDAVIIGHSQLEKIPVSAERQEKMIRAQISEVTEGIASLGKQAGQNFSVKQLEKTKRSLETKLKQLTEGKKRDDVVTFEELGIDKMFVDEAHNFKNLFLYTKMRNVAGIQQTEAQKSSDLFMKCQYLDELTGGKGTIFATGTPVSNSMTEFYTMMRYLQNDTLKRNGMLNFDAWASNFGETVTAIELAPEGTGYRAKTRFAKFYNLPELMNMFRDCADIKTADMLNLPVPEAHFHNIVVKPTELQKEMVSELSKRAKLVHDKLVEPEKDNMLKITSDGRKIGLDQRMMNPLLPDESGTKVNACLENVHRIYTETTARKSTQLVFCDFSTPKTDGTFNLYDDIRDKLIAKGVPKNEIAYIHDADTEVKKKELFAKVRSGKVRILLGSTAKMGAGTNVQDKLIALHHLDCPWRPSDLEQREGRIIRQGNENKDYGGVEIFRYMTEATFDAYLYQTIENKQRFISQIMSSKSPVRSCEDADEATLSYAEVKALCAGNPLIKEKMDLDVAVTKLKVSKANHVNQQYRLEDQVLKHFPEAIRKTETRIKGYESDSIHLKSANSQLTDKFSPMVILGKEYTEKETAGATLIEACKHIKSSETLELGSYKGFDMALSYDSFAHEYHLELQRDMTYTATLGRDELGNITRVNNALDAIPKLLENSKAQLETLHEQLSTAKSELGKPFPQEAELNTKTARLAELNTLLNIDGNAVENADIAAERKNNTADIVEDKPKAHEPPKTDKKPSILEQIKALKSVGKAQAEPKPLVKGKENEI